MKKGAFRYAFGQNPTKITFFLHGVFFFIHLIYFFRQMEYNYTRTK